MERPDFSEIKDFDEFCKYYWYREELIKICKELGLKASGSKIDLNNSPYLFIFRFYVPTFIPTNPNLPQSFLFLAIITVPFIRNLKKPLQCFV